MHAIHSFRHVLAYILRYVNMCDVYSYEMYIIYAQYVSHTTSHIIYTLTKARPEGCSWGSCRWRCNRWSWSLWLPVKMRWIRGGECMHTHPCRTRAYGILSDYKSESIRISHPILRWMTERHKIYASWQGKFKHPPTFSFVSWILHTSAHTGPMLTKEYGLVLDSYLECLSRNPSPWYLILRLDRDRCFRVLEWELNIVRFLQGGGMSAPQGMDYHPMSEWEESTHDNICGSMTLTCDQQII